MYISTMDVIGMYHGLMTSKNRDGYLLDADALENAVMRAHVIIYFEQVNIIQQASLLVIGIARARAFTISNVGIAAIAGATFLLMNGYLVPESDEYSTQAEDLANSDMSESEAAAMLAAWLSSRVKELEM